MVLKISHWEGEQLFPCSLISEIENLKLTLNEIENLKLTLNETDNLKLTLNEIENLKLKLNEIEILKLILWNRESKTNMGGLWI